MRVSRSKRRKQEYVPISLCIDIANNQMIMEMTSIHRIPICLRTLPYLLLLIDPSHLARLWDKGEDRVYKLKEAIHGLEGEVSRLRKRLSRIEDRVWRGTPVQVHPQYRFYHLLDPLLSLYSNSNRITMDPLRHLANMVNLIRVLVHGFPHPLYRATTQDLFSPHLPLNSRPLYRFIMTKSHLFHLPFSIP